MTPTKKIEACSDDNEEWINSRAESYTAFTEAVAATGLSPKYIKWVFDGALIDTRSNVVSVVGCLLLPAGKIVSMTDVKPDMKKNDRRLNSFEKSVDTSRTM